MTHSQSIYQLDTSSTIAVIGAGVMGIGIAQVAAASGNPVLMFDQSTEAAENALAGLAKRLESRVERGKMLLEERDQLLANITLINDLSELAECALVIEVIVENLQIKQSVFASLEEILADDAVIASNTSSFSISALAKELRLPQRFVGMHFFNPAPVLKLVEVVSGLQTDAEVAQQVFELAQSWGKTPVHVKSSPGFIVNRVARPFYAEALKSLNEGVADAATIDAIMRDSASFKLGPFQLIDLIGLDINQSATESIYQAYYQDPRFRPSVLLAEMVNAGLLGRKNGRGFYDYSEDAVKPEPNYLSSQSADLEQITVFGDLGVAQPLVDQAEAAGITVNRETADQAYIQLADVRMQLSNGQTASELAAESGLDNIVLFDLALDYAKASTIALTVALQADESALATVVGFFRQLDKQNVLLKDVPGLLVMRTVCMLANEAADAVNQGVADDYSVDAAMTLGVAWPKGPLSWAGQIGYAKVVDVLLAIQASSGEERYRCSPFLKVRALQN